jgi:hypothetical protein
MIMEPKERDEFILLTEKALGEADQDRFVEVLMERDSFIGLLLKNDPGMFKDKIKECLLYEGFILDRLEEERNKVIGRIDKLSKSRRTPGMYAPKFPFPPMPAFIDRKG